MLAFCFSLSSENIPVEKQVKDYLIGIKFISSDFTQISSGSDKVYTGHFWLAKERVTKVKIEYKTGLNHDIFVVDKTVAIVDKNSKKEYKYSISQTPVYSILSGNIDFSREKFEIIENSSELLRLKLVKSSSFGGVSVTMIFTKYQKTGNIKNLEAWIIDEGKEETLFSFDESTLFVNDEKKVPKGVFEKK